MSTQTQHFYPSTTGWVPDGDVSNLQGLVQIRVTPFQYILGAISLTAILALGVFSTIESADSTNQAQILSAIETPGASIIYAERETLVFATRLAQWANGGIPRRTVQIARNLLAQRLSVIDSSGLSVGERASAEYLKALRNADALVASGPIGALPAAQHSSFNQKASPIIEDIFAQSRAFVSTYQRYLDQVLRDSRKQNADQNQLNLLLLYIFLIFGGIFLFTVGRSNFKNYRNAKIAIGVEQRWLNRTIEDLNTAQLAVTKLQDLDHIKNSFISMVNHELRTPLTSIIGYIEIIREEELVAQDISLSGYLDVLERNADILLSLVESILSLSKIDSERGKLSEDKVWVNEVVDNAIFLMKPATEKKRLQVFFSFDGEYFVQGSANQLSQVLINLLGNAAKFSPEGGVIKITLDEIDDEFGHEFIQLQVIDNGIGVPPEDIERLFGRFFRAQNALSQQYPGTGLGLAIAQEIIAKHGGEIHVSSIINQGTTFTIKIPRYEEENKMIAERRPAVLQRALTKLVLSTPETFKAVTHEIGGSLGFYDCAPLSEEILEYSRKLEGLPSDYEIDLAKNKFLAAINQELQNTTRESNV